MSEEGRPEGWGLRVRAAYHLMCGDTQGEVAQRVGRTARTVRRWQNDPSWSEAIDEARDNWLGDVLREARAALYLQLKKARDPVRAMQVLERLDPDLAPPAQRLEHTGEDGGPVKTEQSVDLSQLSSEDLKLLKQLKSRAQAATNGASP